MEVEARLLDQDEGTLVQMIEILGIEDDVTSKTKMQKIKIIKKGIDSKMEGDETVARTCLEQLLTDVKGSISLSRSQKKAKVNACEVPKEGDGETGTRVQMGANRFFRKIRQMKSKINDLKGNVNAQKSRVLKPNWGRSP